MKSKISMKKNNSNGWLLVLSAVFLLTHVGLAVADPNLTADGAKKYFGDVNAPQEIDTRFGKKSMLPLQLAAGNNDEMGLNMVRALLKAGALPNKLGPDGDAALHTASIQNAVQNIRLLVKSGADVNLKNKQGETALLRAVAYHQLDAATALLNIGADPNIADSHGNTAIHLVVEEGNAEQVVKILTLMMQNGGNIKARNKEGDMPLQSLLSIPRAGSKRVVQFLLDAGADPNATDLAGNTALHEIAAQQVRERGKFIPLLVLFIKAGAKSMPAIFWVKRHCINLFSRTVIWEQSR